MANRFDECCPHCRKKLKCHGWFESRDYSTNFEFPCDHCGKQIEMIVHTVPEFEMRKAETPEEYQARRQAAIARGNGKQ